MKIKILNRVIFEYFDHYVLKLDLDGFNIVENQLKSIKIDKNNLEEAGRAIGNTTKKWILTDYPYAEGYYFQDETFKQVGSCWVMFQNGDEKLYKIRKADSFIFRLEVNEQFRGKGYSKEIMNNMISIIKDHGCHNFVLVCAVKNKIALNLYKSIGMSVVGRKRFVRVFDKNIPYHVL